MIDRQRKLNAFIEAERIAGKSKLTMKDFKPIKKKIETAARKHARKLLAELSVAQEQ